MNIFYSHSDRCHHNSTITKFIMVRAYHKIFLLPQLIIAANFYIGKIGYFTHTARNIIYNDIGYYGGKIFMVCFCHQSKFTTFDASIPLYNQNFHLA